MSSDLEQLVEDAIKGEREPLEMLVQQLQNPIYRMSFRMLGSPEDAEDAAQEILIKVITHLGTFRGESAFFTWVFRIATNHLLNTRKRRAERLGIDFELWEELGSIDAPANGTDTFSPPEMALLAQEVRIGCMQGLLLCLDRDHRMAMILGEIFEVTSQEGAFILEITPEAFRKRLSRGRMRIHAFMRKHCSLVKADNVCSCQAQVARDLSTGWVDPENFRFREGIAAPETNEEILQGLSEIEELARVTYLFRNYPAYRPPAAFAHLVKDLIDAGRFPLLNG